VDTKTITADTRKTFAENLSIRALMVTLFATNGWFFAQALHYTG
jgi:hypothetical protein